jgi:hypothetical protein
MEMIHHKIQMVNGVSGQPGASCPLVPPSGYAEPANGGTVAAMNLRHLVLLSALLAAPAGAAAPVTSSISPIPDSVWAAMQGKSFNPAVKGCAGRKDLRLLVLPYRDYEGRTKQGRMIVHRSVAKAVQDVFLTLYRNKSFAIAKMELIDAYGGDDNASMAANNTSGYNCRQAAGSTRLSSHARGLAIDVNPRTNPFVSKLGTFPPAATDLDSTEERNANRNLPGLISASSAITMAFKAKGWVWGGAWKSAKDYQHFSADGR